MKRLGRYYFDRNGHDEESRNQYLEENRGYLEYALSLISSQRYSREKKFFDCDVTILDEASKMYTIVRKLSRNSLNKNEFIKIVRVLKAANCIEKETINITSEPLAVDYMFSLSKRLLMIHKNNEGLQRQLLSEGWKFDSDEYIPTNEEIEPVMAISSIPYLEFPTVSEKTIDYSTSLMNEIVYEYLFNNKPMSWIDMNLLPDYSWKRGDKLATKIILNKVGLTNRHKGFFQGVSIEDAVDILEQREGFKNLVAILKTIWFENSQNKGLKDKKKSKNLINEKQNFVEGNIDFTEENQGEIEFQKKIQELPTPVLGIKIIHKPKKKSNRQTSTISEIPLRDALTSKRALAAASYLCEIDKEHEYFKSKASQENYVEAHHLIPMQAVDKFDVSIDVEANIVSLCPNCHRKLHHAEFSVVKPLVVKLHEERRSALKKCHIPILLEELLAFYK